MLKNNLLFLLLICRVSTTALLPDEQNNVDLYHRCNPAVVNITATTLTRDFFLDIVPQQGAGSGAIIKSEGYILTNHHVIGNAVNVEVTLFDKSSFPAKVIGTDPDSDLAVLKIQPKNKKLSTIGFSPNENLSVGQKVLAIGNPFGLGGSLSVGVISSLGRDIRSTNGRLIKDIIQTDAAINPGNSGGPLIDSSGNMIGVNAQIVSRSGGSNGVGFAISLKTIKRVAEELIQHGFVRHPDLGFEGVGLGEDLLNFLRYPISQGVMVLSLVPKGPAHRAGLRTANKERIIGFRRIPIGGDVIYKIDSIPVATYRDILDYIGDKKAGENVTIHFYRGNKSQNATIKLQFSKSPRDEENLSPDDGFEF